MFTWKPIHEETAKKLLEFEEKQGELVKLLQDMSAEGLNIVPVSDHPTENENSILDEIDPFTFLSTFNRSLTFQNRIKSWRYLKTAWGLKSDVPRDFHGIPVLTPQNAWFFSYKYRRKDEDIPNLWNLARAAIDSDGDSIPEDLFNKCLNSRGIGVAKLTTGLFWIAPEQYLPLVSTTLEYLEASDIRVEVSDKKSYDVLLGTVRNRLSDDFMQESHQAWVYALKQNDIRFDSIIENKDKIWNSFLKKNPDFVDFSNPGGDFQAAETDYKRAGIAKFKELGGREQVARLLKEGDPDGALKLFKQSVSLNLVSYMSWRPSIGSDQPDVLKEILDACLEATEKPYDGRDTLLPIFDAMQRHDLNPAWDTLSVILWALRPDDYFPIKISYYRELAKKLDCPLPSGRPDPQKFHQLMSFGKAFREIVEEKNPADWVDVQSFIWDLCNSYMVNDPVESARKIWLIAPGEQASHWEEFYNEGLMGIGWDYLGDLSEYGSKKEIEEEIKKKEKLEHKPSNSSHACWEFARVIREGDLVIAKQGISKVIGIGRVTSGYIFDPGREAYMHIRKVDWLRKGSWGMGKDVLHTKTLTDLTPYPDFVGRILNRVGEPQLAKELFGESFSGVEEDGPDDPPDPVEKFDKSAALKRLFMSDNDFDHILKQLNRKKNIILQGPPGVGKTFVAQTIAYALMGEKDPSRLEMVQFHQSYGYEEFIQGLRPTSNGSYVLRDGVFYTFCGRAQEDSRTHVFIIDEINRGNLSKILGELMMLIEKDKRDEKYALPLAYSDPGTSAFFVPDNVFIIGLMNTADRSLAMVDYALRRRFAFISLKPEFGSAKFKKHLVEAGMDEGLANRLISGINGLNEEIRKDQLDLGEGFCIGHSYFCPDGSALNREWIEEILDFEIRPLLEEYWMEAPEKAESAISNIKDSLE